MAGECPSRNGRSSTSNATTLIIEDSFQPFEGSDHKSKNFRLHQLPWPADVLRFLEAEDVRLRVTLSYFIEPSVASRGWRMRYSYASHGLRFELKRPAETDEAFIRRINNTAAHDENGEKVPNSADDANWYLGPRQRDRGSLISDLWTGAGVSLADCDQIAVRPIGGWWKYNKRADRQDRTVRYSLVMSLDTKPRISTYTRRSNSRCEPQSRRRFESTVARNFQCYVGGHENLCTLFRPDSELPGLVSFPLCENQEMFSWTGLTIDCNDPHRLAAFWAAVMDRPTSEEMGVSGDWAAVGSRMDGMPKLNFQRVPEPKTTKIRVHIDLSVKDIDQAISQVERLGGTWSGTRLEYDEGIVMHMADPEGNEFCLAQYYS